MTVREQIEHAMAQELLTVDQLALLIQYNPQTIYRLAKDNRIPGVVRLGRSIRFVRALAVHWGTRRRADRPVNPE